MGLDVRDCFDISFLVMTGMKRSFEITLPMVRKDKDICHREALERRGDLALPNSEIASPSVRNDE